MDKITKAQVAKIWASAHDLGLDREMLYLLVPRGSISALTQQEASELIEHLVELGARQKPDPSLKFNPKAATQEQRDFIHFLFGKLGWLSQPARMRGFLMKFAGVASIDEIRDKHRAIALIEALKAMWKRQNSAVRCFLDSKQASVGVQ